MGQEASNGRGKVGDVVRGLSFSTALPFESCSTGQCSNNAASISVHVVVAAIPAGPPDRRQDTQYQKLRAAAVSRCETSQRKPKRSVGDKNKSWTRHVYQQCPRRTKERRGRREGSRRRATLTRLRTGPGRTTEVTTLEYGLLLKRSAVYIEMRSACKH